MEGIDFRVSRVGRHRRRCGWCISAPGTTVPFRCLPAPDHRRPQTGTRVPLPSVEVRDYGSSYADPRSNQEVPGASVTELETVIRPRRFGRGIPDPAHEPSNWFFGQQAWWTVGTAAIIARGSEQQHQGRPPVSEGDRAFPASTQAVRPPRSGVGRARRRTPRRSRSAWMTRAALTRSGS